MIKKFYGHTKEERKAKREDLKKRREEYYAMKNEEF